MIKLTGRRSVAPSYMVGGGAQRAGFVEIDSGEDGGQAKPSHRAARAGCSLFQGGAASGEQKLQQLLLLGGGCKTYEEAARRTVIVVHCRWCWSAADAVGCDHGSFTRQARLIAASFFFCPNAGVSSRGRPR